MRYQGSLRTVGVVVGLAATGCGGDDNATPGDAQTPDGGQQVQTEPQVEAGNTETSTVPDADAASNDAGSPTADAGSPDADARSSETSTDGDATVCTPNDAALTPPAVPDAIKVPAGATLVAKYFAQGDQVYICTDTTSDAGDGGTAYTWVLKAPDARLFDPTCMVVGAHYAGPTWWIAKDGSSVVGLRLASAASAQAGAIPQLLLKAVSHDADGGPGVFSSVTFIQRLDTIAGAAPASCAANEVGHDLRVAYSATYYFYTGGIPDAGDAGSD